MGLAPRWVMALLLAIAAVGTTGKPASCGTATVTGSPAPGPIAVDATYTITGTWVGEIGQVSMGQLLHLVLHFNDGTPADAKTIVPARPGSPVTWNLKNERSGVSVSVHSTVEWFSAFGSDTDTSGELGSWNS